MRLSRIDQLQKDIPLELRCDLATTKWVARMRLVGAFSNGGGVIIDTSWDDGAPFHLLSDLVLQCAGLLRIELGPSNKDQTIHQLINQIVAVHYFCAFSY